MENNIEQNWTTIIKPQSSLLSLNLKDLWRYRDLIKMFIIRDFVTFYKQTILGPLWFIIQPLFTALMFTFIFGTVAKISTDGIPPMLFYMAGIVNWAYFSESLTKTSDTFIANAGVFGKVYFPRLTVPASVVIATMIRYIIQFGIFLVVYFIFMLKGYDLKPNWMVLLTPVLLLYMAIMSFGFGIWISSLTTKYRDLRFALPFFVQLWMYATPVVYPLSLIPEKYKFFIILNPIVPVMEIFRMGYLGAGTVDVNQILISIGITFFILITGIIIFNRIEKTFMDTV
ncbi:MAG: ABC transporter permease [Spirochaetae bacterium HGW-Spirochaetae-5]|nr:MAG: ABC transporter permease [Spirochaetae bacterium HGW-Spirochaetae-5]